MIAIATEGIAEMPTYFCITATKSPDLTASSPPCATIDDALMGANIMLGNGAASVWIVDGDGNLILPADQVTLRLNALDPALSVAAVDNNAISKPAASLPLPPLPS